MKCLRIFNIISAFSILAFLGLLLMNFGENGSWKRIPSAFSPAVMLVEEPSSEVELKKFFEDQSNVNLIKEFHYGDGALQLKQDQISDLHVIYYFKYSYNYVLIITSILTLLSCVNIVFIEKWKGRWSQSGGVADRTDIVRDSQNDVV